MRFLQAVSAASMLWGAALAACLLAALAPPTVAQNGTQPQSCVYVASVDPASSTLTLLPGEFTQPVPAKVLPVQGQPPPQLLGNVYIVLPEAGEAPLVAALRRVSRDVTNTCRLWGMPVALTPVFLANSTIWQPQPAKRMFLELQTIQQID